MKRLNLLLLTLITATSSFAADAWRFSAKTRTAEVKTAGAVLIVGCEMFNPTATALTIQLAGPNGMASSDVEKLTISADGRNKSIKMDFVSNAEGWKWSDSWPDWQGGMFKHLENASKLKVTLMGVGYDFPTTGLASSMQALKKACT